MSLTQKALVIGGSGHLGAAVCRALAAKGFALAFTYHEGYDKACDLEKGLRQQGAAAQAFHLDLRDMREIKEVISRACSVLHGLDALVVASGLATSRPGMVLKFFDLTPQDFDAMLAINVRGVFFACQESGRIMAKAMKGKIIIVGSIDGVKPVPAPVDYACCKGALWAMTQALAKELGPSGVLVNLVAPGILEAGIADLLDPALHQEYIKHCSLKRVGRFSEIAAMIAFLAGPRNTYLTGQAVILDGGL